MIRIIGPRDKRPVDAIDTTSRSDNWSKGLSPFHVGPIPLYEEAPVSESKNMENAWQYAKVYPEFVTKEGEPNDAYFEWAKEGWSDKWAHRYPRGKGAVPLYSYWAGKKLDYIEARKKIYAPLYGRAVVTTAAFHKLLDFYKQRGKVTLWDFDGYDYVEAGVSLKEVVNDPDRKMGHAFVLAMLLERMV